MRSSPSVTAAEVLSLAHLRRRYTSPIKRAHRAGMLFLPHLISPNDDLLRVVGDAPTRSTTGEVEVSPIRHAAVPLFSSVKGELPVDRVREGLPGAFIQQARGERVIG